MISIKDCIFDVFAKLPSDRKGQKPEIISLVERVVGVTNEQPIFTIDDAESADLDLVIEYDFGQPFDFSQSCIRGENVNAYMRNFECLVDISRHGVLL